jgi:hypothetical protein
LWCGRLLAAGVAAEAMAGRLRAGGLGAGGYWRVALTELVARAVRSVRLRPRPEAIAR